MATAASAAFPPVDKISNPAADASGCEEATMPPRPRTGLRRDGKRGSRSGEENRLLLRDRRFDRKRADQDLIHPVAIHVHHFKA